MAGTSLSKAVLAAIAMGLSTNAIGIPIVEPAPYVEFSDSPFATPSFDYFFLDDFEDGFDAPGVSFGPIAGAAFPFVQGIASVDADDGTIDGRGDGFSLSQVGSVGMSFFFDQGVLGELPNHFGLVATELGGEGEIILRAFDSMGNLLEMVRATAPGGSRPFGAFDDFFLGFSSLLGISRVDVEYEITVINPAGGFARVDHLQYGNNELVFRDSFE